MAVRFQDDDAYALADPEAASGKAIHLVRDGKPHGDFNTLRAAPPAARIEIEDLAFHPGSAVMLPTVPGPPLEDEEDYVWEEEEWLEVYAKQWPKLSGKMQEIPEDEGGEQEASERSTLEAIAVAYRFLKKNPDLRLFLAGHADASEEQATELSIERGRNVAALLTGDREGFVASCEAFSVPRDAWRMCRYFAHVFGWDCDPGPSESGLDSGAAGEALARFRASYNQFFHKEIPVEGSLGAEDWGAFFDACMKVLASLLGLEEESGLAEWRSAVQFVASDRQSHGYGALVTIPRETSGRWRSKENRRVEILAFPSGALPSLGEAESAGKSSVYGTGLYEIVPVEPRGRIAEPIGFPDELEAQVVDHEDGGEDLPDLTISATLPNLRERLEKDPFAYIDYLAENPPRWPGARRKAPGPKG